MAHPFERIDVLAADAGEQGLGAPPLPTPVDEAPPAGRVGDADVVRDREVREERELLEDANDALPHGLGRRGEPNLLPREQDCAGVGLDDAGGDLDERALTRSVLAQYGVDRAAPTREIHILERPDPAVVLGDPGHLEKGRIGPASIPPFRHGSAPRAVPAARRGPCVPPPATRDHPPAAANRCARTRPPA